MKKKAVTIIVTLAALCAAAFAVIHYGYQYGYSKFSHQFLPNTTIEGNYAGYSEMDEYLASARDRYPTEFTITENDGTKHVIPLTDIILNHDIEDFVQKCKDLAADWYKNYNTEISFTPSDEWDIDYDKLKSLVHESLDNDSREEPEDAYLDEEAFVVIPEKYGNKLYEDKAWDTVLSAINSKELEVTLDDSYYLKPTVFQDDEKLNGIIEERESFITGNVKVKVAASVKDKITEEQLLDWLTYENGKFDYDKEKISEYTTDLAVKYNTAYSARDFVTTSGRVITVGTGENDSYAGYMLDEEETAENIYNALINKEKKVSCSWILEGYTMDENGDIGGTYIEISISAQHMWYYQDYELTLDTDIVSGLESNPERRTPRGIFYLLQMSSPYVMHGDYGQQPCQFFIKVTWDGVAIHDADWQSSFGGSQYLYSGSHGCINTPYSKVAALWDYLDALEDWQVPVIIYD